MGVALGWQRMYDSTPYISGMAWNDGVSRNGNTVSYSVNFCLKLESPTAYWDYVWYVDMQIGNHVSDGRKVKGSTASRQIIGGREYYQSNFNGNFTGSVAVGGKDSSIRLRVYFHDSIGNHGQSKYWDIPIPKATSMDNIIYSVSDITTNSAKISSRVTKTGDYSTITSWKLEYGVNNYNEHTINRTGNNLSQVWNLSNLTPNTAYKYRLTVNNSAGYSKTSSGSFRTLEEDIGVKVMTGGNKNLIGYVITGDGRKRKIKEIRTVAPL